MNKLNDIFKMISQMEKNANEVKLGTHEIKLSLLDDINENYKRLQTLQAEAYKLVKEAEDKYKSIVDRSGLMESIAEKGIQMCKELGVNPKEFILRKNDAQENQKIFSKYLNLLK